MLALLLDAFLPSGCFSLSVCADVRLCFIWTAYAMKHAEFLPFRSGRLLPPAAFLTSTRRPPRAGGRLYRRAGGAPPAPSCNQFPGIEFPLRVSATLNERLRADDENKRSRHLPFRPCRTSLDLLEASLCQKDSVPLLDRTSPADLTCRYRMS